MAWQVWAMHGWARLVLALPGPARPARALRGEGVRGDGQRLGGFDAHHRILRMS